MASIIDEVEEKYRPTSVNDNKCIINSFLYRWESVPNYVKTNETLRKSKINLTLYNYFISPKLNINKRIVIGSINTNKEVHQ